MKHLTRARRLDRAGFSMLEVVIALAILAVSMVVISGSLMTAQRTVNESVAQEAVNATARRVAERVADELRDLNFTVADMVPNAPSDFRPTGTPSGTAANKFQFRVLTDFDATTTLATLSPTRLSASFCELYRDPATNRVHVRRGSGFTYEVAREHVTDLVVTRAINTVSGVSGPPTLLITVQVTRRDPTTPGRTIVGAAQSRVVLRNQVATAN